MAQKLFVFMESCLVLALGVDADAFRSPDDESPGRQTLHVALQGVSGVAEILSAHQPHEGGKDSEPARGRHFQFMIDLGLGAASGEDE